MQNSAIANFFVGFSALKPPCLDCRNFCGGLTVVATLFSKIVDRKLAFISKFRLRTDQISRGTELSPFYSAVKRPVFRCISWVDGFVAMHRDLSMLEIPFFNDSDCLIREWICTGGFFVVH